MGSVKCQLTRDDGHVRMRRFGHRHEPPSGLMPRLNQGRHCTVDRRGQNGAAQAQDRMPSTQTT
jgi:hypothetical protein